MKISTTISATMIPICVQKFIFLMTSCNLCIAADMRLDTPSVSLSRVSIRGSCSCANEQPLGKAQHATPVPQLSRLRTANAVHTCHGTESLMPVCRELQR